MGNTDSVTLRPARDEDAPAVAEIWNDGWADGHLGHVPEELVAARTRQSFVERSAARVADTTVADSNGVVAGFVMIVGAEVEQVYVSKAFRGTDVATVLLTEAERIVAAKGHAEAWLAVVVGNARARRFYERNGWRDGGAFIYEAVSADGPIPVSCHRYLKPVA